MPLSCRLVQPAHDLKHRDPSCCCACVQVSPRLVGLALGHVLNLTGTMQWAVRQTAEAENNMTRRAPAGPFWQSRSAVTDPMLP